MWTAVVRFSSRSFWFPPGLAGQGSEVWRCSPFVKASDRFFKHLHPVELFTLTRSNKGTVNKSSCCSACYQICVDLVNVEVTHCICSCLVFSRRKKAPTPITRWRLQFMRDGMLLDESYVIMIIAILLIIH